MVVRELVTLLGFTLNDGPLKKYDKQINSTKERSNGLATAARGIGTAYKIAAGLVAVGVGWISKNIIAVTAQTERYRVTLGTMIGDQEKANKIIHDLDYSPLSDFYGTAAAIGGLQSMVTFGMQAETASDILSRLGDIAQGDSAAFQSLSLNMGQVFAKGKADATDLKQFVTQGFDVVGEVARQSGRSRAEIEKAGVTYAQTASALESLTNEGGKYYGMLAKQMNTVSGIGKQFKSLFAAMGESIGFAIIEPLKDVLQYILNIAKSFQDSIVDKGVKAFKFLIHIIAQVIIFFEVFQMRLRKMGVSFEPLIGVIRDVFGFIGSIIQSALPAIQNFGAVILAAFEPIRAFVRPILEALEPIVRRVFGMLAGSLESLVPKIRGLTPLFGFLGSVIGKLIGPILAVTLAIRGVNTAIVVVKGTMLAVKTVIAAVKAVQIGYIAVMRLSMAGNKAASAMMSLYAIRIKAVTIAQRAHTIATKIAAKATEAWNFAKQIAGLVASKAAMVGHTIATWANTTATKVAQAASGTWNFTKMIAGMVASKVAMIASTVATYAMAAATKVAAVAMGFLNAAFIANPIGLIVLGIVAAVAALTAGIILLVKNWDKIGPVIMNVLKSIGNFFVGIGKAIAGFFTWVWGKLTGFFSGVLGFIRENLLTIINVIITIIFPIAGIVMVLVRLIIKHWDTIKDAISKIFSAVVEKIKNIWSGIVAFFSGIMGTIRTIWQDVWNKILEFVGAIIEGVKADWQDFIAFLTGLWEGIKEIASVVWESIKGIFFGVIDGIRAAWQGFADFFSGLWEAIKEGPAAALEYIQNAFFGIFERIGEKFTWFIDVIREGWEKVKGFFGGVGKGVVNFFTGGDPQGDSGRGPGGPSPSAAVPGGGSGRPSLAQTAMQHAAVQNTYNNSNASSSAVINSSANINVNVPPGTTAEQAQAISRQVDRAVQDSLSSAIGGARGLIPSPEARRY